MEGNRALSLSALMQSVGNTLRMNPDLFNVWVTAEISGLHLSGGHWYMELIEKNDAGQTVASCRAMIWANNVAWLHSKFLSTTGREISSGIKVMVKGGVSHHIRFGLSFTITDIDPSYTLGDMERIRREILERLHREGILKQNKSLPFPALPQRIAVISSASAAGYGDFMNQLMGNPDGFKYYPYLFAATMQGEKTSASIRQQLELIESTLDLWDCVVIIRGGGSTTDLNGFDEYELAKAVALFPLPIIVGIGHERDRTVLDEIARVRCKTPTAVAATLIDALRYAYSNIVERVQKIARYSSDALVGEKHRLSNIEANLPARVSTRIMRAQHQLGVLGHTLELSVAKRTGRERERIAHISHAIERSAFRRTSSEKENLKMVRIRLINALQNATRRPTMNLQNLENILRVLSPLNTLKRGYSITRVNGKAISSIAELKDGEIIETTLPDGTVASRIIATKENPMK